MSKIIDGILSGKKIRAIATESNYFGLCTCGEVGEVGTICKNCQEEILDSSVDIVNTDAEEPNDSRSNNQRIKDRDIAKRLEMDTE